MPLKKGMSVLFTEVQLYGIITLAPSMNFPVGGLGFGSLK